MVDSIFFKRQTVKLYLNIKLILILISGNSFFYKNIDFLVKCLANNIVIMKNPNVVIFLKIRLKASCTYQVLCFTFIKIKPCSSKIPPKIINFLFRLLIFWHHDLKLIGLTTNLFGDNFLSKVLFFTFF